MTPSSEPDPGSRPSGPAPTRGAADTAWVHRLAAVKAKFAVIVLVGAVILGAWVWFKEKVLVIDPGKGTPIGLSVRTDAHIATLLQTLEAYTPSLHRDHSKDTYRVSLFLVPLDDSPARLIPVVGGLSANAFSLAKILGSDGRTLWFDAAGVRGVDLGTFTVLAEDAVRRATSIPAPVRSSSAPFGPKPEHHLAAGFFTGPSEWLGLHSPTEAAREFKPKSRLKRVVRADDAKQARRFHRGVLDPDASDGRYTILSMTPLRDDEYLNAAFLRMEDTAEPIRLTDPAGALMIYTSLPAWPRGTLMVARVDAAGAILWTADTGIDRFRLAQILPDPDRVAFVGPRPAVPDKVSEPLLVMVDNRTGRVTTTSLWQ